MQPVIIKKCEPTDDLKIVIADAVNGLGGIGNFIKPGEKVLVKPNVNTADPFPASSDPAFVKAVVELVIAAGAGEVIVGDSSTFSQNTRANFNKLGLFELEKIDPKVKVISFDEHKWIKTKINGKYLKSTCIPEAVGWADKIIFLPCCKTHFIAKFTGALKLGVGLMKRRDRLMLHALKTEEKVAELNLAFKPDLNIMDARKCFITKGPTNGEVREPNLILASVGRLAMDLEEIKIIQGFEGNDLAGKKPEDFIQIRLAKEIGIE